jgi:hypothetical protein
VDAVPRFRLEGRISTDAPAALRPALRSLVPEATVREDGPEFVVVGTLVGADAKEVNRTLLSALRRIERRTRLRALWTGEDGVRYRFFDYVLKRTDPP